MLTIFQNAYLLMTIVVSWFFFLKGSSENKFRVMKP